MSARHVHVAGGTVHADGVDRIGYFEVCRCGAVRSACDGWQPPPRQRKVPS